jgi:hypothetical protein
VASNVPASAATGASHALASLCDARTSILTPACYSYCGQHDRSDSTSD